MNAIIIDDDMPTADVIQSTMDWSALGIDQVHVCYNIASAKKLFESNPIEIAICDIEMPMGSGLELLQWVREREYRTEFIFLTSHERFDYASTAIRYHASGYVVKPFNQSRMEQEIIAAAQKILNDQKLDHVQLYEEWFSRTAAYVEANFWRDIFLQHIIQQKEIIDAEIRRRRMILSMKDKISFVLVSSGHLDAIEAVWGKGQSGIYEYSLEKILAESLLNSLDLNKVVTYHQKNTIYTIVVLGENQGEEGIQEKLEEICSIAESFLKNTITAYISNEYSLEELGAAREHLEVLDSNNVSAKGNVFHEDDEIVLCCENGHILDQNRVRELLNTRKQKELLNLLKFSMESLASKKMLTQGTLIETRQDLLQALYVFLSSREIQANKLFGDAASVAIEQKAVDSIMDMIRWQAYAVTKTINYVNEVEKSDSIVEKAKAYVAMHYGEPVSRTEIAESVYLTPEYMAKIFKKETGISLKQYISDYRIEKAKELLCLPDTRVSDVATKVGFDNFSYFSTVFKKTTGMSPNEYQTMQN